MQAGGFRFSTPVAGKLIAHSNWCTRATAGGDPNLDTGVSNPPSNSYGPSIISTQVLASSSTSWYCPVDVNAPPGSVLTITGATLNYFDFSPNCRVQADLRYKQFGTASGGFVASTVYSGTDATDFASTVSSPTLKAFPAFSLVVPGDRQVWINATIAFSAAGGGDCRYSGVLIDYTVDRP